MKHERMYEPAGCGCEGGGQARAMSPPRRGGRDLSHRTAPALPYRLGLRAEERSRT